MLKSFVRAQNSQEVGFWEGYFSAQSFYYLVSAFEFDPLRPLFAKYCASGELILEGGCGLGNYIVCLRRLGGRPVGLDFGTTLLTAFKQIDPGSPLTSGDVCALPFRTGAFDVYYSGGVMEHFEEGPARGLREAARVLRKDGIFLVSVPYQNPMRSLLAVFTKFRHGLFIGRVEREAKTAAPEGWSFFQYFYRSKEFRQHLEAHGFEILEERPYSLWRGLTDIPPFSWVDRAYAKRHAAAAEPPPGVRPALDTHRPAARRPGRLRRLLKHLIFAEDRNLPGLGFLIARGCGLAANMNMYVCRRV